MNKIKKIMDIDTELKSFNNRLQKVNDGMKIFREFGFNEDLLLAYLCHNLHISEKEAKKIMDCYEEFYDKLVKKWTMGKLKEEGD